MTGTIPLFGGIPGGPEMLVILLIAILLFGANKIPKLARSSGEAIGEFQKGRQEVEEELKEMKDGGSDSATETTETTETTTETATETETESTSTGDKGSTGGAGGE
jgi:sec-independent protein translocase protein TatA